jgi:hypothetical protein
MINTKLQSIIDTKSAIGNAIVNKGGTITSETPFFNYAAQIDGISTGTPQTIFAASDGSKWAFTNAVNLTNVSGNVTHDFNYWQPANNSTSDPILNIGTVGANISGNIQLVQVNQVNISQYVNIVATDTDGAKYEGFNGYDSVTNPTPTGNTTFNQWLLNNSATGTVLFANATFTTGTYNGPNSTVNEASMPFISNSANYGGDIWDVPIANGFVFAGGDDNQTIQKFHKDNLVRVGNTISYNSGIRSVITNNGFIYVGGGTLTGVNRGVSVFRQDNLALVGNTVNYGGEILSVHSNNGFLYVGGADNQTIQKFGESNRVRVGNTANFGALIFSVTTNNGFIYAGGFGQQIKKYGESNLSFIANTANYGGLVFKVITNNGFVYMGGDLGASSTVQKFYEGNLAFVGNTPTYGGQIYEVISNNGFLYVGGATSPTIKKYYESNLAFVGNTANYGGDVLALTIDDGIIYAGGRTNRTIQKFEEAGQTTEQLTFYTATKIKE